MDTAKIEKAGVCFAVGRQGGPNTIEVRLNHDTISVLTGVRVAFELLNGITIAQAKKIVDVLNENVIGVMVTTVPDVSKSGKTEAALGLQRRSETLRQQVSLWIAGANVSGDTRSCPSWDGAPWVLSIRRATPRSIAS